MKINEWKEQLEKIRKAVIEVKEIINDEKYFVKAKELLDESCKELEQNNFIQSIELINKAKESAIKEKEVLLKIGRSQKLIGQNLIGAKPDEATKHREASIAMLRKGDVEEADILADLANITAQPHPEYLLQKARDNYTKGRKQFEQELFDQAIETYKQSLEEYEGALKLSEEKKDPNLIKNIEDKITFMKERIEDAAIAFDNQEMVKFVDEADRKYQSIDSLVQQHAYDDIIEILNEALGDTTKALKLAKKRKFEQDEEKIQKNKKNYSTAIEVYQVAKGKYQLENAIQKTFQFPEESEKEMYSILDYLESLKPNSEALQQVKERCKIAIIEAKLTQAKKNMEGAEKLYLKEKFYDAREIYENDILRYDIERTRLMSNLYPRLDTI